MPVEWAPLLACARHGALPLLIRMTSGLSQALLCACMASQQRSWPACKLALLRHRCHVISVSSQTAPQASGQMPVRHWRTGRTLHVWAIILAALGVAAWLQAGSHLDAGQVRAPASGDKRLRHVLRHDELPAVRHRVAQPRCPACGNHPSACMQCEWGRPGYTSPASHRYTYPGELSAPLAVHLAGAGLMCNTQKE